MNKWTCDRNDGVIVEESGTSKPKMVCQVLNPERPDNAATLEMLLKVPELVNTFKNVLTLVESNASLAENELVLAGYRLLKYFTSTEESANGLTPVMKQMLLHIKTSFEKKQKVTAHSLATHPEWQREFKIAQLEGWVNIRPVEVQNKGISAPTTVEYVGLTPSGKIALGLNPVEPMNEERQISPPAKES